MIPRNAREWLMVFFYVTFSLMIARMIGAFQFQMGAPSIWAMVGCLFLVALGMFVSNWTKHSDPVDIWGPQAMLMVISGQHRAHLPELNKTMVLYSVLMLEEIGETIEVIAAALRRWRFVRASKVQTEQAVRLMHLEATLEHLQGFCRKTSKDVRKELEHIDDFFLPLNRDEAKAMLDGNVDTTVVTAGFAEAAGLPAADGYVEVQRSNLSKANPDTGLIDKDESGKWLKGRNYSEPDTGSILDMHYDF